MVNRDKGSINNEEDANPDPEFNKEYFQSLKPESPGQYEDFLKYWLPWIPIFLILVFALSVFLFSDRKVVGYLNNLSVDVDVLKEDVSMISKKYQVDNLLASITEMRSDQKNYNENILGKLKILDQMTVDNKFSKDSQKKLEDVVSGLVKNSNDLQLFKSSLDSAISKIGSTSSVKSVDINKTLLDELKKFISENNKSPDGGRANSLDPKLDKLDGKLNEIDKYLKTTYKNQDKSLQEKIEGFGKDLKLVQDSLRNVQKDNFSKQKFLVVLSTNPLFNPGRLPKLSSDVFKAVIFGRNVDLRVGIEYGNQFKSWINNKGEISNIPDAYPEKTFINTEFMTKTLLKIQLEGDINNDIILILPPDCDKEPSESDGIPIILNGGVKVHIIYLSLINTNKKVDNKIVNTWAKLANINSGKFIFLEVAGNGGLVNEDDLVVKLKSQLNRLVKDSQ